MKIKEQIFRFIPSNSKKLFQRFDGRLQNKNILRVEVKYADDGAIERVDVFYEDIKFNS